MRPVAFAGGGTMPATASFSAAMCAGVVPQQPPSSAAPSSANLRAAAAKSSGETRNCVCPSTTTGSPALGLKARGTPAAARSSGKSASICSGPSPQLKPTASAPSDSATVTALSTSAPVSMRPPSSKVIIATMGRALTSRAAKSAAFNSYTSVNVSKSKRSASREDSITSRNNFTASSNSRSPTGLSSRPRGPMSAAT